ncbi:MAG TPA: BON domain-containing protein [Burkholderiales bacterium]|nr:BON domain-containing protein [Burkholderiales bacterium]
MTRLKRFSAFLVVALMATAAGCAGTSTKQSTGAYLDDSVITTKVKTAIFNEPSLSVNDIKVETDKNVVSLSGMVGSSADMNKAVALARAVPGVASVKNDMRLK